MTSQGMPGTDQGAAMARAEAGDFPCLLGLLPLWLTMQTSAGTWRPRLVPAVLLQQPGVTPSPSSSVRMALPIKLPLNEDILRRQH